jgi:hypothetical protein
LTGLYAGLTAAGTVADFHGIPFSKAAAKVQKISSSTAEKSNKK